MDYLTKEERKTLRPDERGRLQNKRQLAARKTCLICMEPIAPQIAEEHNGCCSACDDDLKRTT